MADQVFMYAIVAGVFAVLTVFISLKTLAVTILLKGREYRSLHYNK
jgi:hypothetical protein